MGRIKIKFNITKILIACFFLTSNFLFAQYSISGSLKDSENLPVYRANILVFSDNTLVKFTYSNDKGLYNINDLKSGNYKIEVSSLSYEKTYKLLELRKNEVLNFVLKDKLTAIDEIVIDIERDIEVRNDTIIFKADAFNNRKGIVVEELLKKIPGIEIDDDGTIKFQGKLITNVKIDNDDLFDGGYAVLTKNLNADVIEKVQILQNYSKNPLLKNVRDTEDVAINLTLKEDRKSNLFGNASFGYASNENYDGNANLISLLGSNKHYLFLDFNNIGDDAIANINGILSSKNDDKSYDLGRRESANTFINLNTNRPIFDDRIVNFNNSKFTNLNSIFNLSKTIKLKTTGLIFSDEKDYISQNITNFLVEDPFQLVEDFSTKTKEHFGLGKVVLEWNINKRSRLEYIGSYYYLNGDGNSDLTQNGVDINERLDSKSKNYNHFLHYTKKIKDSSAFIIAARYIKDKKPQKYRVTPYLFRDFFNVDEVNIETSLSSIINDMEIKSIQASFLKTTKNANWEFHLGLRSRIDDLTSEFYFEDNNSNEVTTSAEYQNDLQFTTNFYYLSGRYRQTFNKIDFFINSSLNLKRLKIEDVVIEDSDSFFYFNTNLNIKYSPNKRHEIISGFGVNQNTNKLNNTFVNFVTLNYRTFYKGLGENELLKSYNMYFNYRFGNWSDKFTANLNMSYTHNRDFISNSSNITVDLNEIEMLIFNSSNQFLLSTSIDRYLDFLVSNLKIKLSYNERSYKDIINTVTRSINSSQLSYGFEIRSAFSGVFNYTLGTEWRRIDFKINNSSSNNTNNESFIDIDLNISDDFNIFLENERFVFGNISGNSNTFYFTNINAQYKFKDSKLSAFFRVNNLFDNKSFNIFSLTDITESISKTKLISRYFMLGLNYRF